MQPDYIDAEFETDVDVDSVPVVIDTSAPLIEQTYVYSSISNLQSHDSVAYTVYIGGTTEESLAEKLKTF